MQAIQSMEETNMNGFHHAGGRGPIINLLKNADFSSPFATGDWKGSAGVTRGSFPGELSNHCAVLPFVYGANFFLRQNVDIPATGKYLLTFRYVLAGDARGTAVLGVNLAGSFESVVLYRSSEGVASHCVLVLESKGGVLQPLHMNATGVAQDEEPLELFIDDMLLARYEPTPPPILRNGDFENAYSKDWKLSENAAIETYGIHPERGSHLALRSASEADVYAEQAAIRLERPGAYVLTFTINHSVGETLPRKGEVSLKSEGVDRVISFEHAGQGDYTRSFIFELSAEDIAKDMTLRIAKLKNDEQIPVFWFIDNVQLIEL
jgi:hypothetical protein